MFNFGQNEWVSIISKLTIIGLIFMNMFVRTKNDRILKIKQLSIWLIIILATSLIFSGNNIFKNLIPYRAKNIENENAFEIEKSNDGHFYLMVNIDNKNILFLIDTGASITTLTMRDARRLNIDTKNLSFRYPVSTANGKTFNAQVELKNIKINDIVVENKINAFISKELDNNSLLGMNFLQKLKSYKVEQNKMILYY